MVVCLDMVDDTCKVPLVVLHAQFDQSDVMLTGGGSTEFVILMAPVSLYIGRSDWSMSIPEVLRST